MAERSSGSKCQERVKGLSCFLWVKEGHMTLGPVQPSELIHSSTQKLTAKPKSSSVLCSSLMGNKGEGKEMLCGSGAQSRRRVSLISGDDGFGCSWKYSGKAVPHRDGREAHACNHEEKITQKLVCEFFQSTDMPLWPDRGLLCFCRGVVALLKLRRGKRQGRADVTLRFHFLKAEMTKRKLHKGRR